MLRRGEPLIAGLDFGGVVEAVGSKVTRVMPGGVVAGICVPPLGMQRSYCDKLIVSERRVCPMPEGVDPEAAGTLAVVGYTAWVAADRIKVIISERVPLEEFQRAFEMSQSERTIGKIVLIP